MKLQRKNNKWFTLIELLVVITIIGILATGWVTVYTSQIQKARDTTRLNALESLKWWVEMVYQDKFEYPELAEFYSQISTYVKQIPRDPKNGSTCAKWNGADTVLCMYVYNVGPDINGIAYWAYEISTAFENMWNIEAKAETDPGEDNQRYETWIIKKWDWSWVEIDINTKATHSADIPKKTLCTVTWGGLWVAWVGETAPTLDADWKMTLSGC